MAELPIIVTVDDAKNPTLLVRLLRSFSDKLVNFGAKLEALKAQVSDVISLSQIRNSLQATGPFPINVTGLRGVLADPQPAAALRYDSVPGGLPLQSLRDSQFVIVKNGTGYDLYTVLGGNPNTLFKLIAGASGGNMMTTDTAQNVSGTKTFTVQQNFTNNVTVTGIISKLGANGSLWNFTNYSQEIILSTTGATTDSATNLIAGNCLIIAVTYKITQTISGGGVTTIKVGDAGQADRFFTSVNITSTDSGLGMDQWKGSVATDAKGPLQYSPEKVRITMDGTPTQGKVRVSVFLLESTPPTS